MSEILKQDQILKILEEGKFYWDLKKRYPTFGVNIFCDLCYRTNLQSCLGYDKYDLCMYCVAELTSTTSYAELMHSFMHQASLQITQTIEKLHKKNFIPSSNTGTHLMNNFPFKIQDVQKSSDLEQAKEPTQLPPSSAATFLFGSNLTSGDAVPFVWLNQGTSTSTSTSVSSTSTSVSSTDPFAQIPYSSK